MIQNLKRSLRLSLCWTAGGAIVLAAAALYAQVRYGSPRALPILMRGDALLVAPPRVDLGKLKFGDQRDVALKVKNVGDREICITGVRTSCTCVSASQLPLTLAAAGEGEVRLKIRASATVSDYRQTATLYVSGQASGEVPVTIISEIDPASFPRLEARVATAVAPERAAGKPRS